MQNNSPAKGTHSHSGIGADAALAPSAARAVEGLQRTAAVRLPKNVIHYFNVTTSSSSFLDLLSKQQQQDKNGGMLF